MEYKAVDYVQLRKFSILMNSINSVAHLNNIKTFTGAQSRKNSEPQTD